jgi:hypothetical protein
MSFEGVVGFIGCFGRVEVYVGEASDATIAGGCFGLFVCYRWFLVYVSSLMGQFFVFDVFDR